MALVSVQYEFEYKATDGRLVTIKPNECYILVSKSNEHWWHVRKDQHTRPFYVPAQYVKELTSQTRDSPSPNKLDLTECVTNSKPVDVADVTPSKSVIRLSTQGASRETYRFSTFGFSDNVPDIKPCETLKEQTISSFAPTTDNTKTPNSTGGCSFTPAPVRTDLQMCSKPHPVGNARNGQKRKTESSVEDKKEPQTFANDDDMDFPLPPNLPIYDIIPELIISDFDSFPDPPSPFALNHMSTPQQETLTEAAPSPTDALPIEKVRF